MDSFGAPCDDNDNDGYIVFEFGGSAVMTLFEPGRIEEVGHHGMGCRRSVQRAQRQVAPDRAYRRGPAGPGIRWR